MNPIKTATDHKYTVQLPEQMDQDMVKLANRLNETQFGILRRALSLYIAAKNRHLDATDGKDKSMNLVLDLADKNPVKFIIK